MCPHTTVYVSPYYYTCVPILLYVSSHFCICVLIQASSTTPLTIFARTNSATLKARLWKPSKCLNGWVCRPEPSILMARTTVAGVAQVLANNLAPSLCMSGRLLYEKARVLICPPICLCVCLCVCVRERELICYVTSMLLVYEALSYYRMRPYATSV